MQPSTPTAAAARRRGSYRYVSDEGARRILEYKYSGSDASLLYNHVISPLAQQLVDRVLPPNLAPNTITISGLALVIFAHACMLWCVSCMLANYGGGGCGVLSSDLPIVSRSRIR